MAARIRFSGVRYGTPLLLMLGVLALLAGPGPVAAQGADEWLRLGRAAELRDEPATAYLAFDRARQGPDAEVRRAAELAQIRLLIHFGALTEARYRLRRLSRQLPTAGWRVAAQALQLEAEARLLSPEAIISQTLALARELRRLAPRSQSVNAYAQVLQAKAWVQLYQPDSALPLAQAALRWLRRTPSESLALVTARPEISDVAFLPVTLGIAYTTLATLRSQQVFLLAQQPYDDAEAPGIDAALVRLSADADACLDSALRAEQRAHREQSNQITKIWRFRGLNARQWADMVDGAAEARALQARADAYLLRAEQRERRPNERAILTGVRGEWSAGTDPVGALTYFEQAKAVLFPEGQPTTLDYLAAPDELRYFVEQQAEISLKAFEETGQETYLRSYYAHAQTLASLLAASRRQALLGREDPALYQSPLFENYSLVVAAADELHRHFKQPQYLDQAFATTQHAKAYRLLFQTGGNQLTSLLDKGSALMQAYRSGGENVSRWNEQAALARYFPALRSLAGFREAPEAARQATRRLQRTLGTIKDRFPRLAAHTFSDGPSLSLEQVRRLLPANGSRAAVEYLRHSRVEAEASQQVLYAFVVQRSGTQLLRLELPGTFSEEVDSLVAALARPNSPDYPRLAARFYQQVMAPVARVLDGRVKQLLIAPDDELWKVPFEALLTSPVAGTPTPDYRQLPYLLRRYHIAYTHSLTLYGAGHQLPPDATPAHILALAPFADPGNPLALPATADLLGTLRRTIGGTYRTSTQASEALLRAEGAAFPILHLATHAEPDLVNPMNSRLRLADGALTVADLLGLHLHPQLVVLSACETGVGRPSASHEGMNSLSWAFAYGGAASQVSTLWQVDDAGTASVLAAFYQGLRQGQPKDEALHDAKLAHLEAAATSETGHPFYWAGLVFTGDERPLHLAPPGWFDQLDRRTLALLAGLLVVAATGGAWRWWRTRRAL